MIERTSAFYSKNDIKLWWSIGSSVVCDANQIGQRCDQFIGLVYAETEIQRSGLIWTTVLDDEN